MPFQVFLDRTPVREAATVLEAIEAAETAVLNASADSPATYSVWNDGGELVASVSSRRIEGAFMHQRWGGRNDNEAITEYESNFDATAHVLLMPLERLVALRDCSDAAADIGQAHIKWDGPFDVEIVDSICAFFGVDEVGQITEQALEYARARENPQPPQEVTLSLDLRLQLSVQSGLDLAKVLNSLRLVASTPIAGAVCSGVEIERCDVIKR